MSKRAVKQIVLASRPKGLPTPENFRLEEVRMPELPQGGLLLRVLYLSLDPYMRGRMDDRKSYAKPVDLGKVMTGESVCEVIASDQTGYGVGDIVLAPTGWRTHAGLGRRDLAQAGSGRGADHYRTRRPRHARLHCLCGSQSDWEAKARRNSCCGSRKWTRRFTGWAAREACWRDSGGHRRRHRKMPLCC
jgi:hypothetical protein